MNKSLQLKLSVTLMATVLVTLLISILVNNVFLVDYYISGKQKNLVNVFEQINRIYTTVGTSEKRFQMDIPVDDFIFPGIIHRNSDELPDFVDMELAIEQLSQDNNINILSHCLTCN